MANNGSGGSSKSTFSLDEIVEKVSNFFDKYNIKDTSRDYPEGDELGSSRELIEALTELDAKYRAQKLNVDYDSPADIPESLNLQPVEYDKMTPTEIRDAVVSDLNGKYAGDREALDADITRERDKAAQEIAELEADEAAELDEFTAEIGAEAAALTEDMVLQGLVNSTVFDMGAENIRKKAADGYAEISAEYDTKYRKIDSELKQAETEYRNALSAFDLKYAADLMDGVLKLRAEEEKRLREINDYNAEIKEREAEYQKERQELLTDLYLQRNEAILSAAKAENEYERENGVSTEKLAEYQRRYALAKEFYSKYSPEEVGKMLEESRDYLALLLGTDKFNELGYWNFVERKQ